MNVQGKATVPLRQLGWGFLLAWVFCVFYTNAAGAFEGMPRTTTGANLALELFYTLMPLGSSVVALAVILIAEPRFGAPTSHRSLLVAAPLLTAFSTPFMFLSLADPLLEAIAFAAGSVATGVGSALLWVMWGEYYAVLPRESAEGLAPVSAVSAALMVLLVSATDGWVAVALASLFPLLSGWCFYLVWTPDVAHEERALALIATTRASAARESCGARADRYAAMQGNTRTTKLTRTGFGILGVFSVVSIAGMLDQSEVQGLPLQIILLISALMMAIVAVFALSGPRRISLAFLYRWMCPVLVIGFAAIILLGPEGGIVTFAASLAGRFTFCLIAQIYFASYAASGLATPTQATSWGWLFVHAGDLVGCTLWVCVAPLAVVAPDGTLWAATLCIVVLVVVTMLTLNDTAVFHRVGLEKGSEAGDANIPPAPLADQANAAGPAAATASTPTVSSPQQAASSAVAFAMLTPQSKTPAAAGPATLTPQSTATASAMAEPDTVTALAAAHRLTPRETEVFTLLAQGRSIPYIRDELIISRETAATHAKHIYAKLGVHSRQELIDLVQKREMES
ncbi:helix-turn-helix transcriptional regulator [Adlercreutzia equolifaciens]|uniref:response regulator transcription factor n=1 Tax=Adlercreutzia equolifaciens TaxID=446660 RepID=UPI0023AF77FD|nr:helix-turn-helix transcriptional regulator [Adlercreutzia equolifaciens]MDE8702208.1 helix-turn-helix transcriptional regulator [Adlercreutzia equolifaciens]